MAETIRIDDLHDPVHSEAASAALQMVERLPFELTTEAVIDGAREESDVPLFEDEDLFARLGEYVDAVHDHALRYADFGLPAVEKHVENATNAGD